MDDNKEKTIVDLRQDCARWRGRCIEACEMACQLCRAADPDLCRYCRVERILKEAQQ